MSSPATSSAPPMLYVPARTRAARSADAPAVEPSCLNCSEANTTFSPSQQSVRPTATRRTKSPISLRVKGSLYCLALGTPGFYGTGAMVNSLWRRSLPGTTTATTSLAYRLCASHVRT
ncbi:Uncharacterised protein [Mycobacteroides abscessus subsp. abscessus]|nr:Uncharacterised protein [Mycobacteroides abscessus subsp. abscessus]